MRDNYDYNKRFSRKLQENGKVRENSLVTIYLFFYLQNLFKKINEKLNE